MAVDSNYFPSSHSVALAKSASFGVRNITETFTRRGHYNIAIHFIHPKKGSGPVDSLGIPSTQQSAFLQALV